MQNVDCRGDKMSVNRDMRVYELWKKEKTRTASGAEDWKWNPTGKEIKVAVYKKNDMTSSGSEHYREATHTGQTHFKEMKAGTYQLRRDGRVFNVTDFNPDGRLVTMILKEVDTDA